MTTPQLWLLVLTLLIVTDRHALERIGWWISDLFDLVARAARWAARRAHVRG